MADNIVFAVMGKLAEMERIVNNHGLFADAQRDYSDPGGNWNKQWFNSSGNNSRMFWEIVYYCDPEQCVVSFKLSDDDGHGLGVAYLGKEDQWITCHDGQDWVSPLLQILANRFPQGALTERQAFEFISCMTVYHARLKGTSSAVNP